MQLDQRGVYLYGGLMYLADKVNPKKKKGPEEGKAGDTIANVGLVPVTGFVPQLTHTSVSCATGRGCEEPDSQLQELQRGEASSEVNPYAPNNSSHV